MTRPVFGAVMVLVFAAISLEPMTIPAIRQEQRTGPKPKWLRFEMTSQVGLPIVRVSMNHSEGFPLLIDPSIPDVLIDTTIVYGYGMQIGGGDEVEEIDYFGNKEEVPVVRIDLLEIGNVGIRGARALLIDGDDITESEGVRTYGRIGRDLLSPFRLTLYYPRRLLLLEPSPASSVPAGAARFDNEERYVTVDVMVNEVISAPFVVDGSASRSFLDREWADDHGLFEEETKERGVRVSLTVGNFQQSDVPLALNEMKSLAYSKQEWKDGRPVGVIGANLLRELAVTYDFKRGLLWLRKAEPGKESSY